MSITHGHLVAQALNNCTTVSLTEDQKKNLNALENVFYIQLIRYLRDNQLVDFDFNTVSPQIQTALFENKLLLPLKEKLVLYIQGKDLCDKFQTLSNVNDFEFKKLATNVLERNKNFILDFLLTSVYDNPQFSADQFGDEGLAISLYQDAIVKFKLEDPLTSLTKNQRLELLLTATSLSKKLLDAKLINLQPNQARANSPELRAYAKSLALQPLSRYEAIRQLSGGLALLASLRPNTVELLENKNKLALKDVQTYKYFGIALTAISATAIYLLYREKKKCAKLTSMQGTQEYYPLRTEISEDGELYTRTDWKI